MRKIILILFLIHLNLGFTQEICNNAIDDDGLIDLQDSDCQCGPGIDAVIQSNTIPNPNFDLNTCCPDYIPTNSQCLNNWTSSNPLWNFDANYASSCNNCNFSGLPQTPYTPLLPPECFDIIPNGFIL